MLANFSINLFNRDRVVSFKENEYELSTYPQKKFDKELSTSHFKKSVLRYETKWNNEKFEVVINEQKNNAIFSYKTNNNTMEYKLLIHY